MGAFCKYLSLDLKTRVRTTSILFIYYAQPTAKAKKANNPFIPGMIEIMKIKRVSSRNTFRERLTEQCLRGDGTNDIKLNFCLKILWKCDDSCVRSSFRFWYWLSVLYYSCLSLIIFEMGSRWITSTEILDRSQKCIKNVFPIFSCIYRNIFSNNKAILDYICFCPVYSPVLFRNSFSIHSSLLSLCSHFCNCKLDLRQFLLVFMYIGRQHNFNFLRIEWIANKFQPGICEWNWGILRNACVFYLPLLA